MIFPPYLMFLNCNQSVKQPQTSLSKKRSGFSREIRKRERQKQIMEERQSVEISEYISPLLETLPHSVPKMVDYLKQNKADRHIVGKLLVNLAFKQQNQIFLPSESFKELTDKIYLLAVMIQSQPRAIKQLFDLFFERLQREAQQHDAWNVLLVPLNIMVRSGIDWLSIAVLKQTARRQSLLKPVFGISGLELWIGLLRYHGQIAFIEDILNSKFFNKLATHFALEYYDRKQKALMLQVMVFATYSAVDASISKILKHNGVYKEVSYILNYFCCSKSVRINCYGLISNLLIDTGSNEFWNILYDTVATEIMGNSERIVKQSAIQTYLIALQHCECQQVDLIPMSGVYSVATILVEILIAFSSDTLLMSQVVNAMECILHMLEEQKRPYLGCFISELVDKGGIDLLKITSQGADLLDRHQMV